MTITSKPEGTPAILNSCCDIEKLFNAARHGLFDWKSKSCQGSIVGRKCITKENLLKQVDGLTVLHMAAAHGSLRQIPADLLTVANLSFRSGACNISPAHVAAEHGTLNQIPRKNMTLKLLLLPESNGDTPLHLAAKYDHLIQVPKKILTDESMTKQNNEGWTPLHWALSRLQINEQTIGLSGWIMPFHVPSKILTAKNLLYQTNTGWTPAHFLAGTVAICQVTEDVLEKVLLAADSNGITPLSCAARNGKLDLVPKQFLTPAYLTVADIDGETPIHLAADNGHLHQLKEVLSRELLMCKDKRGRTPLHLAEEKGTLAGILGINLPDEARSIIGDYWWELNQRILKEANIPAGTPTISEDIYDLDI